jgi:hypothetical protein
MRITIEIPSVEYPQRLRAQLSVQHVAKDILDWIHGDDSGLAGDADTTVRVDVEGASSGNLRRCFHREISGESVERV